MSGLIQKDVGYRSGALSMRGYYAAPAGNSSLRPGILIVPDAFGLDSYCIGVADNLAGKGFAAFALDLWGARRQFAGAEQVMPEVHALLNNRVMWKDRVDAARDALVAQTGVDETRIAAIGYCLGGSTVLEFARLGGNIKGAVSYHGGLDFVGAEWDRSQVKAKLLICTGIEDPLVPWSSLTGFQERLRAADINWELDIYARAKHSFTRPDAGIRADPQRSGYDAQAHRRSWRATLDFLDEIFALTN